MAVGEVIKMGWLDNLIAWISPEWGARREAWRQGLEELRKMHIDSTDFEEMKSLVSFAGSIAGGRKSER